MTTSGLDIKVYLKERRETVDAFFRSYFENRIAPTVLHDAMLYSLFAGGKRVRPILALASYEACGNDSKEIVPYAAALELIHTYSLIHDDLPAMDDDDLRRGKPTSHKVFGEAIAILAGDALLTEAFMILSDRTLSPAIRESDLLRASREIAVAAGSRGMVAGQVQDMLSENTEPDEQTLSFIHKHKTAALLSSSVRIGPILAAADKERFGALSAYGVKIGLAFQVVDDILDLEGETEELGKPKGSDEKKKKMTYPSLYGLDRSKEIAQGLISEAIGSLKLFGSEADPLREIARYLLNRRN